MKRKTLLLLLLVATVAGVALAGSSIGRNADAGDRHILVAYFSATGNTKSVAETASTVLNADLLRITRDHSVVEGLIESGSITAEQARTHPNRNLITRALGPEEHIECDVYDVTLGADERLLLCSDGLVVTATDEEMYEAVGRGDTPEESLEHLLELSKQRGAPDNVTAVLLYHE